LGLAGVPTHVTAPPVPRSRRWPHVLAGILFFIGAALCNCFLTSVYPQWVVLAAAAVCTAVWAASGLATGPRPGTRSAGLVATLGLLACYAFWLYLAVAFFPLLAWTLPSWLWIAIGAATLFAVVDILGRASPFQAPFALPLGMLIAGLLSGWVREENLVRCDDFLALAAPVELVIASRPDFASCRPGEVRAAGRFPRTIWQAPEGDRVVFTTQGGPVPDGIDGAFCEAELESRGRPHCVGPPINKSQGLTEPPGRDVLLALQWGLPTPTGARGAAVYELSRDRPLRVLAQHWFDQPLGDGFYEPRNHIFYLFSDDVDAVYPVQLPDYRALANIPIPFAAGEVHYDMQRGEGVACGGHTGAAIRGDPFALRFLADGSPSLLERVSMSWGCDWDPEARMVYATVPNLGLLDRIDYDTGVVNQRWWVGFGMRSVEYDRPRRRVYFTNFLRGDVVAFDEPSGREVGRWFVGRFSRWARLTPDRSALLATGNLGIVRISLAP
jgi:hypothetical protein